MLESFEDTGEFWLPDAPTNKVGGTLVTSLEAGQSLNWLAPSGR